MYYVWIDPAKLKVFKREIMQRQGLQGASRVRVQPASNQENMILDLLAAAHEPYSVLSLAGHVESSELNAHDIVQVTNDYLALTFADVYDVQGGCRYKEARGDKAVGLTMSKGIRRCRHSLSDAFVTFPSEGSHEGGNGGINPLINLFGRWRGMRVGQALQLWFAAHQVDEQSCRCFSLQPA